MDLAEKTAVLRADMKINTLSAKLSSNGTFLEVGAKNLIAGTFGHKSEWTHTSARDARDVDIHASIIACYNEGMKNAFPEIDVISTIEVMEKLRKV